MGRKYRLAGERARLAAPVHRRQTTPTWRRSRELKGMEAELADPVAVAGQPGPGTERRSADRRLTPGRALDNPRSRCLAPQSAGSATPSTTMPGQAHALSLRRRHSRPVATFGSVRMPANRAASTGTPPLRRETRFAALSDNGVSRQWQAQIDPCAIGSSRQRRNVFRSRGTGFRSPLPDGRAQSDDNAGEPEEQREDINGKKYPLG